MFHKCPGSSILNSEACTDSTDEPLNENKDASILELLAATSNRNSESVIEFFMRSAFPQEAGNNVQELPLPTSDVDEMPNIDESSEAENATESAANSNSLYPKAYLPLSTKVLMKSDLPECPSLEERGKHTSNIKMPWIKRMLCGCFVSRAKTRSKTSFVDDHFKPQCIPPHSELTVKNIPSSAILGNLPSSVECNVQNISTEDGKEPVISCWSSDHKKRSSKPHKKSSNVKNIDKVIGPNQEIAPRLDNEHTVSITDDLSSVDKSATEDVSSTPIAKTNMHPLCLLGPPSDKDKFKKCFIIDLDETLVHSSFKVVDRADFRVGVEIDGLVHQVYVLKRPFVDEFLQAMAEIYECILFTASLAKYADPVADFLDRWNVFRYRLFRESCVYHRGNYVKDLGQLGRRLDQVVILDNSPASYLFHVDNAVQVSSWFDDPTDRALLDLIPYFERLSRHHSVPEFLRANPPPLPAASVANTNLTTSGVGLLGGRLLTGAAFTAISGPSTSGLGSGVIASIQRPTVASPLSAPTITMGRITPVATSIISAPPLAAMTASSSHGKGQLVIVSSDSVPITSSDSPSNDVSPTKSNITPALILCPELRENPLCQSQHSHTNPSPTTSVPAAAPSTQSNGRNPTISASLSQATETNDKEHTFISSAPVGTATPLISASSSSDCFTSTSAVPLMNRSGAQRAGSIVSRRPISSNMRPMNTHPSGSSVNTHSSTTNTSTSASGSAGSTLPISAGTSPLVTKTRNNSSTGMTCASSINSMNAPVPSVTAVEMIPTTLSSPVSQIIASPIVPPVSVLPGRQPLRR